MNSKVLAFCYSQLVLHQADLHSEAMTSSSAFPKATSPRLLCRGMQSALSVGQDNIPLFHLAGNVRNAARFYLRVFYAFPSVRQSYDIKIVDVTACD